MLVVLLTLLAATLHLPQPTKQECLKLAVTSAPPQHIKFTWDCEDVSFDIVQLQHDNQIVNVTAGKVTPNHPYVTNVTFNPEPFPVKWPSDEEQLCLEYKGVAFFNGSHTIKACVSIQPYWMTNIRQQIGGLSLPQLFIPGTHNSACDKFRSISRRRRRRGSRNILDDWMLTQDQSVWRQLVYGIRYLDLRVGHYIEQGNDTNSSFWVNHDIFRVQPLVPVLQEIARFLEASPQEVIVLDFHRFPVGFQSNSTVHTQLAQTILEQLRRWLVPRPPNPSSLTLQDIWSTDKRLVICYSHSPTVAANPWLWEPIAQKWGNQQTVDGLYNYLNETFGNVSTRIADGTHGMQMWAAMVELTPTQWDIFMSDSSLAQMAEKVNSVVGKWFQDKTWLENANIVATDFFLGNNFVQLAMDTNIRRGISFLPST